MKPGHTPPSRYARLDGHALLAWLRARRVEHLDRGDAPEAQALRDVIEAIEDGAFSLPPTEAAR